MINPRKTRASREPLYLNWKADLEAIDWSKVHSTDLEERFRHPSTRSWFSRLLAFFNIRI